MQLQWKTQVAREAAILAATAHWTPDDVYEFLGGSEVSMEAHRTFENGVVGDCKSCGTPTPVRQLHAVGNDDIQRCTACIETATKN
jgi:hypothetical protein